MGVSGFLAICLAGEDDNHETGHVERGEEGGCDPDQEEQRVVRVGGAENVLLAEKTAGSGTPINASVPTQKV